MTLTAYIDTPIGPLTVAAGESIERVAFGRAAQEGAAQGSSPLLLEAERQIGEYFAGARTRFDLPLKLCGTAFQLKVWRAMLEIPYGEVLSYGALAAAIGHPAAARAVGGACHVNNLCILVPCHRIVAANGIGGFGGRLEIKEFLLAHEKNTKKAVDRKQK